MHTVTATVVFHDHARAFLEVAGGMLAASPAEHNLMYGLAVALAEGRMRLEQAAVFATVMDGGVVRGAALRTPPRACAVAAVDAAAARELADALHARDSDCPGVVGTRPRSRELAARWAELSGAPIDRLVGMQVYELVRVTSPPQVAGAMRLAIARDIELVGAWMHAFALEAVPFEAGERSDASAAAQRRIGAGEICVWEDGGEPVCMAGFTRETPAGITINAVYTPETRRRRGYASALVAGMSAHALARGKRACFLYTDASNPTSNAIYQRIGYRHVCDAEHWRFRRDD